jgi:hypothetical protein
VAGASATLSTPAEAKKSAADVQARLAARQQRLEDRLTKRNLRQQARDTRQETRQANKIKFGSPDTVPSWPVNPE